MFGIFYHKYKLWFWLILSILLLAGGTSNLLTGTAWEAGLNYILGIVCLIVAGIIVVKGIKQK